MILTWEGGNISGQKNKVIITKKSIICFATQTSGNNIVVHLRSKINGRSFLSFPPYNFKVINKNKFIVGNSYSYVKYYFIGFYGLNLKIFDFIKSEDKEMIALAVVIINKFLKNG